MYTAEIVLLFLLCPMLVPSSGVAGTADYVCPSFCCLSSAPSLELPCLSYMYASLHHRFGFALLFSGISAPSTPLNMCSSSLLITWPYHFLIHLQYSSYSSYTIQSNMFVLDPILCHSEHAPHLTQQFRLNLPASPV